KNYVYNEEGILARIKRNYGNGLTVDGYLYNGTVGMTGFEYTAESILAQLEKLTSKEKALRIMNQLEVQIYADPLVKLKEVFDHQDIQVRFANGRQSPITLTTTEEGFFKVAGTSEFEIVNMAEDGEVVARFDINITLRIPKAQGLAETGEWSWSIR
ncbi:MAG: hypothetical protein HRU43_02765, partial [Simkaniaceae bacterium]|nr:hypothetical protein [Simkaniaceae bacterium]